MTYPMPGPASEAPSDDRAPQAVAARTPDEPRPLGLPPRTATGHADVDAALQRLGDVDHLATDGHIEVYEDVHAGLRDTLTALDAAPPTPGGAPARPYDHRS